ncbi:MAG: DUF4214 domain-containing protein [Actinomycetota bacterium]
MKNSRLKFLSAVFAAIVVVTFMVPSAIFAQESGVEDFVARFYNLCLGREPDPGGLANWVSHLEDGRLTGADVAERFIYSQEFEARDTSNQEFVEIMYAAFFGREPDPVGYAGWMQQLERGRSRQFVLEGFINSAEFQILCAGYGIEAGNGELAGDFEAPVLSVEISGSGEFISIIQQALSLLRSYHGFAYNQVAGLEGIYGKDLSGHSASGLADIDDGKIYIDLNSFSGYGQGEKVKIIAATISHELNHIANRDRADSMAVVDYERMALEQELETSQRIDAPQWYIDYISRMLENIYSPSTWWWRF